MEDKNRKKIIILSKLIRGGVIRVVYQSVVRTIQGRR